jgi:hypothetical protein
MAEQELAAAEREQIAVRVARGDLPGLARAASEAARSGQRDYLWLVRLDLGLLVLAALASAIEWPDPRVKSATAFLTVVFMVASLALTALTQRERQGRAWIEGRAVAEAAKTSAWRYMTRAEPYRGAAASADVDLALVQDLDEALHNRAGFTAMTGGEDDVAQMITPVMRQVRALSPERRAAVYARDRLAGQQKWYGNAAATNRRQQRLWFAISIGAQVLGLTAAVLKAIWVDLPINLAGVFITVAASALAWMQLKQYQEQAQAYGLAAQDLALVQARFSGTSTEDAISRFVDQAETVMSREHGQWIARRDTA